jgi:hypothetical protein
MKKFKLSFIGVAVCFMLFAVGIKIAATQEAVNLTGTWELSLTLFGDEWDGGKYVERGKDYEFYICHTPEIPWDYLTPNLLFYFTDDPNDPFYGFAQGGFFGLFKENVGHLEPDINLGREMMIGKISRDGTVLKGDGIGFDSNYYRGSIWTYNIKAEKIGDLPGELNFICDILTSASSE